MFLPRLFILFAILLFGTIALMALFKKKDKQDPFVTSLEIRNPAPNLSLSPIEVELDQEVLVLEHPQTTTPVEPENRQAANEKLADEKLPDANRIEELFNKNGPKLPIVETITYKKKVSWQQGRPAWLSDYASHYGTSRHFIARSLNGKPDYFKQDLADGDRFNVFKKDQNLQFYLLIDTSRCKMWFYYVDLDKGEKVLLKTYQVGLGRKDQSQLSGILTPLGIYSLGSKITIYKPKVFGQHHGERVEMIRVFGSRWIPFDKEISDCTAPPKGFGIHGVPWVTNDKGELVSDNTSLGKYESDGCIRLATEDMEELFAIIITKPTVAELVKDFHEAKLYTTNPKN